MRTIGRFAHGISLASVLSSSACFIDHADGPDGVAGAGIGAGLGGSASGGSPGQGGYAGENFPPPSPPPVCGDGQIRSPESCDDSNTVAGDGCDELCQLERGWLCSPGEGCVSLYGDRACSADACSDGATCIERGSRLNCACPSQLPAACENLRFRALGLLPDSDSCSAHDVSGDGTTVVGACTRYEEYSGVTRESAFRWTASAGTAALGLAADKHSDAVAVSRDGSIILGSERAELFGNGTVFRLAPEGVSQLGLDFVTAASADGNVVAGGFLIRLDSGFVSSVPAIWTPSGVRSLSIEGLDADVQALVVSADGSVIAGSGKVGDILHAVRWDSSGVSLLPVPVGAVHGEVGALTADGSSIYGSVIFPDDTRHLARWTSSGVEDLGDGSANAVSADGSVILAGQQIWDATHGWRQLRDLAGADLEGWTELIGVALSDDGKVVVGSSQYLAPGMSGFRAFVLSLP
jgi:cysteine-rich repeat protein